MIYICIPCHDEAATVGLVIWKLGMALRDSPREYRLIVGDDASSDATAEVLRDYDKAVPLTVIRNQHQLGYAATVELLLREALKGSDRHKRDVAVLWPADYTVDPAQLEELLKKFESGADLVVGEATLVGEPRLGHRLVRRWAPRLLGRKVRVRGVHDIVSGVAAIRLVALRQAFRERSDRWLETEGWAANAELLAHVAAVARQVESVPISVRADLRQRPSRVEPWSMARQLWHARTRLIAPQRSAPARERDPRSAVGNKESKT